MSSQKKHLDALTLSLLVDDMLPVDEYHKASAHLDQCPQCKAIYQDLQTTSFAMLKLETLTPPSDFAQSILEKLPPQDPVSEENTITFQSKTTKINPLAQLPWQQWGLLAACAALALSFLPSSTNEPTLERGLDTDTSQSSNGRTQDSPQQQNESDVLQAIQEEPQMETASTQGLPSAMTPFTLEEDISGESFQIQEETSLFSSFFPPEGLADKGRILLEMDMEQMEEIVQNTTGKSIQIICNYNETPANTILPLPDPWTEIPSQEWISYKLWTYDPEDTTLLDALVETYPTLSHQLPQCTEGDVFLFLIPSHIPLVEFAREN